MIPDSLPSLPRRSTGVPGLDTILDGGLPVGKLCLIVGAPGTGKTILTNQIAFHHAATGGRVLYLTFLSESHTQMLSALATLRFFDRAAVGQAIQYFAAFPILEQDGIDALASQVAAMTRTQQATLLVIDGLSTIADQLQAPTTLKRFLHALQAVSESAGCTTLLLSHDDEYRNSPAHIMVDGLLELSNHKLGLRMVRELEVWKLRGSAYLEGTHHFTLSADGLTVYPRTEALFGHTMLASQPGAGLESLGVPRLDAMLGGGLRRGSAAMVFGPHGSGKTLLGLQFLAAGAQQGVPGLLFGFNEQLPSLIDKARGIGLDLEALAAQRQLVLRWNPTAENISDRLVQELLALIDQHGIRRLVLDSIHGFLATLVHPERQKVFFGALMHALRARAVTTLFTVQLEEIVGPGLAIPTLGVSEYTDAILCLRYVEIDSQLQRLVSILKLDHGGYDTAIRSFQITADGLTVDAPFSQRQGVLTGLALRTPQPGGGS